MRVSQDSRGVFNDLMLTILDIWNLPGGRNIQPAELYIIGNYIVKRCLSRTYICEENQNSTRGTNSKILSKIYLRYGFLVGVHIEEQ